MSLTLFTIPKPFRGRIGIIQRNAIESWARLRPACQIILLGNDDGTPEAAKEFGAEYIPELARNEFGTPLLDSAFAAAERVATNGLLCYINADIILMRDFMDAAARIAGRIDPFLMIGQRWELDIERRWDFVQPEWEDRLRSYVAAHGAFLHPMGSDYFLYPRGFWGAVPPFAIGRCWWDYSLVDRARSMGAAVVDVTGCVMAVHQTHDYSHFWGGKGDAWGPEARRNYALAGGHDRLLAVGDATHILTRDRLSAETPSRLKAKRIYYGSRILVSVGINCYVAADVRGAWGAWSKAARQDPSVVTPSLLLLMAKSLLGSRVLRWSRRLRGRHRPDAVGTA